MERLGAHARRGAEGTTRGTRGGICLAGVRDLIERWQRAVDARPVETPQNTVLEPRRSRAGAPQLDNLNNLDDNIKGEGKSTKILISVSYDMLTIRVYQNIDVITLSNVFISVLCDGLLRNFNYATVEEVDCPNLNCEPWNLASEGFFVYIFQVYIMLAYIMLAYIMLAYIMLAYIMLAYIMLAYIMLAYIMLAYIMLAYIMLAYIIQT